MDTNNHPESIQRTGITDRVWRVVHGTRAYVCRNPPRIPVKDSVRRVKAPSSHRVRMGFPEICKGCGGRHFVPEAIFAPPAATLSTIRFFRISRVANLLALAGSYLASKMFEWEVAEKVA